MIQLFLLHFAGGSIYSFDFLKQYISKDVQVIPLELPGRGKRFEEPALKTKKETIQDYVRQITLMRNKAPYCIYGHSMGATLGLSVAHKMQKLGDQPLYLIVSGNAGPGVSYDEDDPEKQKKKRYLMNDKEFKEELRELGGVPEEVLLNEELYSFFMPIMRSDFEVLEKDDYSEEGIQLQVPIYAIMGTEEKTSAQIDNWRRFTLSSFKYKILEGNHFFIYEQCKELSDIIKNCYEEQLQPFVL
ncbi:thioesterase II family protein [Dokdonia ponticola]|uniref:Thioesterase II family protein n=1 Tax=Dokdonia ponticola TaxID=2041041 RepID=A0ABV9HZQ4_9FLAO